MFDKSNMSFQDYLLLCAQRKRDHPELRMGQVYFNVLSELEPSYAEYLKGLGFDPFHDDANIGKFLYDVCATWGKKPYDWRKEGS
jgi:hypothetical protein